MEKKNLEKTLERILQELSKQTELINNLVTKEEFRKKMNEIFKVQDKILAMLTHLERERIFPFDRIERLEGEVDKIKKHLAIV